MEGQAKDQRPSDSEATLIHPGAFSRPRSILVRACGATGIVVGCLVLAGWAADIPLLKSGLPGFTTMKVNTALAFILVGVSLGTVRIGEHSGPRLRFPGQVCAVSAAAVALLTLAEYMSGLDLGIDQLLVGDMLPTAEQTPGRMAPATALVFLLLSAALLLLQGGFASLIAQGLVGLALLISALSFVGYLYGVAALYHVLPVSSVALHTSVTFLIISIGTLAACPPRGPVGILASDGAGGILSRRLVPAAIFIPVLLGWLRLAGQQAGLYSPEFGIAVFVLLNVTVFTILIYWIARKLQRVEEEHKQAEQARRKSEQVFAQFMEHLPGLAWIKDQHGRYEYANAAAEKAFQTPRAQLYGKTDAEVFPQQTAAQFQEADRRFLESGTGTRATETLEHEDGTLHYSIVSKFPIPGPDEGLTLVGGIAIDITDRVQAGEQLRELNATLEKRVAERSAAAEERALALAQSEQALRHQTHLLTSILNSISDAVVVADQDGKFLVFNPAAERILGSGSTDAPPEQWPEQYRIYLPDGETLAAPAQLPLVRAMRGEETNDVELVIRTPDCLEGTRISVSGRPLQGSAEAIEGGVVVFRDITARKQTEAELRQAKEAAEAANRAKSEFLANMSHEIRTPMNGVIGMTELALDTNLSAEQRACMNNVKQSAEALLTVINDILDFSKIEAGRLDLDPVPFRLRDNLGDMLKPLALRAHKKGLELAYNVWPDVPDVLYGDLGRLRQVIVNLVGNAIKFTHRGEIEVQVQLEAQAPEEAALHFLVADTGIGIPADKLAAIFAPFVQADGSTTRRYGGTGLGLAISARLVEMLGGRIQVASTVGQGSTFQFSVRMGLWHDACPPPPLHEAIDMRPLRILLAEDNLINQKVSMGALAKAGHQVFVANNGKEAIAALDQQPFDLVLMDVQMPEMDGLEAATAIRAKEKGTQRRVPIIALTAHAMKGDRERILAAGMDGYVAKPIRQEELWKAIGECAAPPAGAEGDRSPAGRAGRTLDRTALLARVGGDVELLLEILELFRSECPRLMEELHQAVLQKNAERIQWNAHSLKGTFGNLSASDAWAAAVRIEELSRGGDLTDVEDAFASLQQKMHGLELALAQLGSELTS